MTATLEEEPVITKRDLRPYEGVRYFRQRKEFFYSLRGRDIDLDEVRRCERRHTLLVSLHGLVYLAYLYGVTELFT